MLFNSYEFIFFFLPIVFTAYRFLVHNNASREALLLLICLASLAFYAWWQPIYLLLLGASLLGNYTIARILGQHGASSTRKVTLAAGIMLNLALLAYYKYSAFIIENLQYAGFWQGTTPNIILPLAISFFTFQQIAYLVTCYKDPGATCSLLEHVFFITFFPHLIAGPIVYKNELIDQVRIGKLTTSTSSHWQHGIALFILGLSKKLLIGDTLAELINPLYNTGGPQGSYDAWIGSFLFGFQIYFDFSAYSDMALGVAYLFGLRLPINFDSPYKATNYREFWRRWHITLFRFFRDHVYIPLKGNSNNLACKTTLSFLVFFLSGLWHGAAWTFVAWGIVNWFLIFANDTWIFIWNKTGIKIHTAIKDIAGRLYVFIAMSLTFMLFRSPDFETAKSFTRHLFSPLSIENSQILNTMSELEPYKLINFSQDNAAILLIAISALLLFHVWYFPNAVRYCLHAEYADGDKKLGTDTTTAIALGFIGWLCIMALPKSTEFLYFQF